MKDPHDIRKAAIEDEIIARSEQRESSKNMNEPCDECGVDIVALLNERDQLRAKCERLEAENASLWTERRNFVLWVTNQCGDPCDLRSLEGHANRLLERLEAQCVEMRQFITECSEDRYARVACLEWLRKHEKCSKP